MIGRDCAPPGRSSHEERGLKFDNAAEVYTAGQRRSSHEERGLKFCTFALIHPLNMSLLA